MKNFKVLTESISVKGGVEPLESEISVMEY